jgi:hypothetical protein
MNWSLIIQLLGQLLPVALKAVQTVEEATSKPTAAAVAEVISHLTPGAPLSPSLAGPEVTAEPAGH